MRVIIRVNLDMAIKDKVWIKISSFTKDIKVRAISIIDCIDLNNF